MVEEVTIEGILYALILRAAFHVPGVQFFTPGHFSQQLGYMAHPAGHTIAAHVHRDVRRDVLRTQEVLFVRRGRLRVDFFREDGHRVGARFLESGDVILLARGGHGFEVLEACEMIEVKQGPYLGDEDKILLPTPAAKDPQA